MAATNGGPISLVGTTFDCAFGPFVPRLTVLSPTELRVQATIGATRIDEVVKNDLTGLRPGLFIMSWTELSGTFVVQVQDHNKKVVHNLCAAGGRSAILRARRNSTGPGCLTVAGSEPRNAQS